MQPLPSDYNWVDASLQDLLAANSVGVPFDYSQLLNSVSGGGGGPGRCIGRVYVCERIEIRALFAMVDGSLIAANAREMQAGGTPMTIPAASWGGGNGPALPITFTTTAVNLPAKLYWGGLRPFRMLVVYDANPSKTGANLTIDRLFDLTADATTDAAGVMPFNLQYADQYCIVLDEVFNPKDSTGEMFVERIIDLRAFWASKGYRTVPASVLNTTGLGTPGALSSGGYWIVLVNTGFQSFDYTPGIYRGASRVVYKESH